MNSLAFCVALVIVTQAGTAAQVREAELAAEVERAEQTVRLARAEAAHYRIVRDDDPHAKIELREKPILKWSNPTEGALFGSVLLWTVDGRPETVASLYRWYGKLPKELLDGALFAFVQGTDPEIFLLIEAEKMERGARWRYAASRMNMFGLHLALDDKQVWSAEEMNWNDVVDRRGTYTIIILEK